METKKPLWKTAVMYLRYIVSVPLILLFGLFALMSGVSFISGLIIGDYGDVFPYAATMVIFGTAFILIFPKFDNFLNKHIKFLQNPIINLILRFVMMSFVFIICIAAVGFHSIYLQPPCHDSDNEGKCLINNKPLMCINNTAIMKASICGCRANETVSGEKCVPRPVQKTCPSSCNDSNPCTNDSCGRETNFSCVNLPLSNVSCGKGMQCVAGECVVNTCTDGTLYGECALSRPMFCTTSGQLTQNLDMCGCPASCDDGISNTLDVCGNITNYECGHKTLSAQELTEMAISPPYADLFKNPSNYTATPIKYVGSVLQSNLLRVAVNGNSDQVIYATHNSTESFVNGEYVEIIGWGGQNKKLKTVSGNVIEHPHIDAFSVRSLTFDELPKHKIGDSVMINDNTVLRVKSQRVRLCETRYKFPQSLGYWVVIPVEFTNPGKQGESNYISYSSFTLLDSDGKQYPGTYFSVYSYSWWGGTTCDDAVTLEGGEIYPNVVRAGEVWFKLGNTVNLVNPLKLVYGDSKAVYEFNWK